MKQKSRSIIIPLALCLCISAVPRAHAQQEAILPQEVPLTAESSAGPTLHGEGLIPTPQEAYAAMIALKTEDPALAEGKPWTNATEYKWQGGTGTQNDIAAIGAGCVAFAYRLSDEAFGNLPARMTASFEFSDVMVGDILWVNNTSHVVIVLQINDTGVLLAEGNYNGTVHWGRTMTKAEVEEANYLITRYPEGYTPDDPSANDPVDGGEGSLGPLNWTLTKAGTLTISGSGAMPEFSTLDERPWNSLNEQILKIVIQDGVTQVSPLAFQSSTALSAEISASVTTIGASAFRSCPNLIAITVPEGVETIGENAFRGCTQLRTIALPASIETVGAGAFTDCTELTQASFAPGSKPVQLGDNLFTRCQKLTDVTLPKSIDRIGAGMFLDCLTLPSLKIPQGVANIGGQAFASCSSLTEVTLPDSVTQIETAAFSACYALKDIYYGGSEAQWGSINKMGDVSSALSGVTIHYNSSSSELDPGHTHTWNSGTVTTPPSCTAEGVRTYTCSVCGETRTETIPAQGHNLVLNGDGDYACENEREADGTSATVVSSAVGEGYLAVKAGHRQTADSAYQSAAAVQQYASGLVQTALSSVSSSLQYTVNTIRYTPPSQSGNGEYVYTVTIRSVQRAAAELITEPLYMVIPAIGEPAPSPAPNPDTDSGSDSDDAQTYRILLSQFSGGEVIPSTRYATQGEQVTLTVHPDAGYALSALTVSRTQSQNVPVQDLGGSRFRFTMPAQSVTVSASFSPLPKEAEKPCDGGADCPSRGFSDLAGPEAWYHEAVDFTLRNGLMNGYGSGRFGPEHPLSRAQLVQILYSLEGKPAAAGGTFSDVDPGAWYAPAVTWAAERGIASGYADGRFGPDNSVTREQLAVMLWRYAGSPAASQALPFDDTNEASSYALEALRWAAEQGILSGYGGGRLVPQGQASRIQAAQMFMKLLQVLSYT